MQRDAIRGTIQRLSDRFMMPQNFDPAARETMLRTHRMAMLELSGQESFLVGVYRRTLHTLDARQ